MLTSTLCARWETAAALAVAPLSLDALFIGIGVLGEPSTPRGEHDPHLLLADGER